MNIVLNRPEAQGTGALAPGAGGRAAIWRDPTLIFLVLGVLIFALYWFLNREDESIIVTRGQQELLANDFRIVRGRSPTPEEMKRLVQDHIDNEALLREALRRGLHLSDPTIRKRLIENLRFAIVGSPAEPSQADLVEYYARNRASYQFEPAISFDHVFFADIPANPAAVLARLKASETVAGDSFWLGSRLEGYGESMVRGTFGGAFLAEAEKQELGQWFGPVTSVRGVHFLKLTEKVPARPMPFLEAVEQVKQDWFASHSKVAVDTELERLKKDYNVIVEN